jgi:hypothetical protein
MRMGGIDPVDGFRFFDGGDVEVDGDCFVVTSDQDALKALAATCVDLLVRNERRDVDEVADGSLGDEFKPFALPHPGAAFHDIDHTLEVTVVVGSGLGVWFDRHGAGPDLLRTDTGEVNRRGPGDSRCLGGVGIEGVSRYDVDSVIAPVGGTHELLSSADFARCPTAAIGQTSWIDTVCTEFAPYPNGFHSGWSGWARPVTSVARA